MKHFQDDRNHNLDLCVLILYRVQCVQELLHFIDVAMTHLYGDTQNGIYILIYSIPDEYF